MRAVPDPSRFKDGDHSSALPYWRKVVGAENRVEDLDKEENRSHGKMLQCPVRDTVRAWSLAKLKAPDGVLNLIRIG
jgi:hypothetical protein